MCKPKDMGFPPKNPCPCDDMICHFGPGVCCEGLIGCFCPGGCPGDANPCDGKNCGDKCKIDGALFSGLCDMHGQCSGMNPYSLKKICKKIGAANPCDGKNCGDKCKIDG